MNAKKPQIRSTWRFSLRDVIAVNPQAWEETRARWGEAAYWMFAAELGRRSDFRRFPAIDGCIGRN
jgi:hypothetical protein